MSKESFKASLIKVIEAMIKMELSNQSIILISHYFNESNAASIKLKAFDTIDRYIENNKFQFFKIEMGNNVKNAIEKMLTEAQLWENEVNEKREKVRLQEEKRKEKEAKKAGMGRNRLNTNKSDPETVL